MNEWRELGRFSIFSVRDCTVVVHFGITDIYLVAYDMFFHVYKFRIHVSENVEIFWFIYLLKILLSGVVSKINNFKCSVLQEYGILFLSLFLLRQKRYLVNLKCKLCGRMPVSFINIFANPV